MALTNNRGMYLNKWTLDFDSNIDVPKMVHVWIHLLQFPLHKWSDNCLQTIGNFIGTYIDRSKLI